ncbi:MAG: DNRLRE domain-containing protein [Gammaproteobacteria bacterium]|nr:DNRLRE domain-containing protein [Gammaproteobacteria bacterium]
MNKRGHSAFSALPKKQNVPNTERGFILLTVVVAITLVAGIALALSYQGASETNVSSGELERDQLRYVAEAGMAHAKFQLTQNRSCSGYTDIPTTVFGGDSYTATYSATSNSPVTVTATGSLASGIEHSMVDNTVRAYQPSTAVILQLGKAAGKDTMIDRWFDIQNYGALDNLIVRSDPFRMQRALLEFDLSAIPASAEIISAKLELEQRAIGTPGAIGVHRVTRGWLEGTGKGGIGGADGATWLSYDGSTSWGQPGGDFDSTLYAATTTTSGKNGQWVAWDIRDLVDEWVSGQFPNYGLLLAGDGVADSAEFHSREGLDPESAPKLTIVFACECGVGGSSRSTVLQPGSDGKDTFLSDFRSDSSYGGDVVITIALSSAKNGLLEFDLSAIPPGAIVNSAELELYLESGGNAGSILSVHRLTQSWLEGTTSAPSESTDGASWSKYDAVNYWGAVGGDFDLTPSAQIAMTTATGWKNLDLSALVAGWVNGSNPNYGMLLKAGTGFGSASFASSDASTAANHPKLTVNYSCPCGVDCQVLGGGGGPKRILFVVGDPGSLTAHQQDKKALMEGWGHTVTPIATSDSQAEFDAAAAAVDVVYVPELGTTPMNELGDKADDLTTAVITEEARRALLLGSWSLFPFVNADTINITDNTHYITETLPSGNVPLSTPVQSMWVLKGTLAPDLHVLGELNGTEPGLAYLESGARRNDSSLAPARRVKLPWGSYDFDPNNLTAQGLTIMQRAIEWGAGAGPAPPAPGYLDQFNDSTCDAAIDYSGSDGAFDWSPWVWTEINELDGPCAGQIRVASDPDIDDAGSSRLRVIGEGVRVYRTVDLTGFSQPILSFDYRLTDYPALDFMRIRVFDGVGYTEIGRFTGPFDQTAYQSASFDLSAFAGLEIQVQFEFNGTSSTRTSYIDNVHVQEASTGASGFYLDEFPDFTCDGADEYSGSNGSIDWTGFAWTESGDDGRACGANVRVIDDPLIDDPTGNRLRLQNKGRVVERQVDLSSFSSAFWSFDYRRDDMSGAAAFDVSVSGDGGSSWTPLDSIGAGTDAAYLSASYDISAHMAPNTMIRFTTNSDFSNEAYIDNVRIDTTGGGGGGGGGGGDGIAFEEFTDASLSSDGLSITIPKPAGTAAGDLMIATVVTDAEQKPAMTAPPGWTLINHGRASKQVTMDVLWKIADASEPGSYDFSWVKSQQAYGWIMRFTGHDPTAPIHDSQSNGGTSSNPVSPAVTTTIANTMIVRIGGFDDDDITPGDPGLSGHTAVTMGASDTGIGTASGGAGYVLQSGTGESDTSNFALTASEEYRAVTIAIAPAP